MTLLKEVLAELFSMFVADARLTTAVLLLVLVVAALLHLTSIAPLFGGLALLAGCVLIVAEAVLREARRRRA